MENPTTFDLNQSIKDGARRSNHRARRGPMISTNWNITCAIRSSGLRPKIYPRRSILCRGTTRRQPEILTREFAKVNQAGLANAFMLDARRLLILQLFQISSVAFAINGIHGNLPINDMFSELCWCY